MKKLLLIFTLLFTTLVFSSPSYADWTKIGTNVDGTTFYVDFDRIKKHDGYVYYWELSDYLKPFLTGDLSSKTYIQGDCKLFGMKVLSFAFHKQPMGRGSGNVRKHPIQEWRYPPPNSSGETILKSVCTK